MSPPASLRCKPSCNHVGFRGTVRRSTLADANGSRDWRIWQDLGLARIDRARRLHREDELPAGLQTAAFALDSTVLDLSLTLFPWAASQQGHAAAKLHTLLDLRGNIPCFLSLSTTKTRDCTMLDEIPVAAGSLYVMDRDYNDYHRLHRLQRAGAFFVVRGKVNLTFRRLKSAAVDRTQGLRSDQTIRFKNRRTVRKYPDRLRRITFFNTAPRRRFLFVTNHFGLPAASVVQLYWRRWEIELFFKWIKQHLRIRHFLGNTPNAMKTQIWIVVSTYVLVAIVRRELKIDRSMSEILQILSMTIFEKPPLKTALERQPVPTVDTHGDKQLRLFDS